MHFSSRSGKSQGMLGQWEAYICEDCHFAVLLLSI